MSQVVIFIPSDPVVPNRAKEYISSANTPEYSGNPDALINPDLSALLPSIPVKYWKRSGSLVIEMTSGEKTALDDSESAAATAATALLLSGRGSRLGVRHEDGGVSGAGDGGLKR